MINDVSGQVLIDAAHHIYPDAEYWYFDEIQDFPEWEKLLNKLHRRGYNLIVTGSNAKLLSSELATSLTGRHFALELFPFSYTEYLAATNKTKNFESFASYLATGGFPEAVLGTVIDSRAYLQALFDSVLLKDLLKRKKIRNPTYLSNVVSLVIDNIAARTSARALSKALHGIPSATTVEGYFDYFSEAYLIETMRAFSLKPKERIQSERKPYVIDTGFIEAVTRRVLPVQGKQLENAVYLELRRKGYKNDSSLYYYRSSEGREIDFIIRQGHRTTQLVQVCLDISAIETRERESRVFADVAKEFPDAECTIVTANQSATITMQSGREIRVVPAYEFCNSGL